MVVDSDILTIGFYLHDGIEIMDFAGPLEVLEVAGFKILTIGKTMEPILSQNSLSINVAYDILNAPDVDVLAFFGGNSELPSTDPELLKWIQKQSPKYYFSVCTGAFILAAAGVLNGLHATTFHENIDALQRNFPQVKVRSGVRYIHEQNVITTAGVTAGLDGALYLIQLLKGKELATSVATYIEYEGWAGAKGLVL